MSWLLVAFIPGLLMLATFGLSRLEAGLVDDTLTARDVAEFFEQAEAADMNTLAREGMPEALDCLHRRRAEYAIDEPMPPVKPSGLARPRHRHSRTNRQFGPPRHANRV
ncbi:hypothetical protein AWC14_04630 [Mycobacterium kyorinense]|uniref:Uncharacterized protein n=2 Tax=Mycobacterium kyorinense TaxID=487514 RepID=A0A1X1XZ45_9MYCO|nr:hypothetical protein AWC14_04630 [Mycobacterium kyorinense]